MQIKQWTNLVKMNEREKKNKDINGSSTHKEDIFGNYFSSFKDLSSN